ncbi:MAG: UDP-2,3-diacylglucosamine diphosphatase [Flavobacteriales bacterium]|nr:MAG: UDP-2,3-diacylglucosamine diphosphatase [Flavobacteriales bacterium]
MGSIYFVSDLHLGAPNLKDSHVREQRFLRWIDQHQADMDALFIVGDLFDFWFEYKRVVPRGFVRTLGRLATLSDSGIPIYFFTGNHDLWVDDYLEKEIGCKVFTEPQCFELQGKKLLVGHGDGLGPGDHGYKFLKRIFTNPFLKWCFARIHPNTGIALADYFSRKSRAKTGHKDQETNGMDEEWLYVYARDYQQTNTPVDLFVFGHRHLPFDEKLPEGGRYINLGDWIQYFTFGKLCKGEMTLEEFKD